MTLVVVVVACYISAVNHIQNPNVDRYDDNDELSKLLRKLVRVDGGDVIACLLPVVARAVL